MRTAAVLVLVALLVLVVGACDRPAPATAAPSASAGAAIDTDALLAAAAANDGKVIPVHGFILVSGGTGRLCSLLLESYPPQCGGGTVRLSGEVPADVLAGLDKTTDPTLAQARWGWVEVTGTFHATGDGGDPTIDISAIRLAAP